MVDITNCLGMFSKVGEVYDQMIGSIDCMGTHVLGLLSNLHAENSDKVIIIDQVIGKIIYDRCQSINEA